MSASKLERIVVGIDEGSESMAALTWAVTEAIRTGARLTLVHAYQWMVPAYMVDSPRFAAVDAVESERISRESATEGARELLDRALEVVVHRDADIATSTVAAEGHPVTVLREQSMGADMIVIGSRGRGLIGRVLLGSVSTGIAGVPVCPVVVVRALNRPVSSRPPIVVGVDGSESSIEALKFAFAASHRDEAPLRVIHSWRPRHLLRSGPAPEDVVSRKQWLDEVVAPVAEEYPDVEHTIELIEGKAAMILTDTSSLSRMIVVGTRGDKHLPSIRLGSVSQGVLHHAWCPVAIVPRPVNSTKLDADDQKESD